MTAPALRQQVASALIGNGIMLGELGRLEEAVAAYEQVPTGTATTRLRRCAN
jgi:hypothetical protein